MCVTLATLNTRLRHWLKQPAGLFAVASLLVALVWTGVPRVEVHAHDNGNTPHTSHAHDHAPDTGEQPAGESVSHAHVSVVPATVAPASVSLSPALLSPVMVAVARPDTIAVSSRPTELFRPPIA